MRNLLNPFQAHIPLKYSQETSENQEPSDDGRFSDDSRGYT